MKTISLFLIATALTVTSASYANDGSAGLVVGISTVAAPAETAKHGYLAQLYDATGLTPTAATLKEVSHLRGARPYGRSLHAARRRAAWFLCQNWRPS